MRIILLICFLIVTELAAAQIHINSFKQGYYYTLDDKKIKGKIEKLSDLYSASPEDKFLLFKSDTGKTEVPLSDICCFVIEKDSFTVSRNKLIVYKVLLNNTPLKLYSYQVFSNSSGAPMMMGTPGAGGGFMMYGGGGYSRIPVYFYGESPDSVVEIKRKSFADVMSMIMADKPRVVAKIKDKTYPMGWMDELLEFYATGQEPQKQTLFKGKN